MLLFPVSLPLSHLRFLVASAALAASPGAPAATAEVGALDSYRAAVGMDFPQASADARQRNAGAHPSAEDRFNLAVVLLNEQPQSAAKLDQARELFTALAADASLATDLRAASLYFHGRLEQSHARPVNPAAASALYARV